MGIERRGLMKRIFAILAFVALPCELAAKSDGRTVTTCRHDPYNGRDCWSRPYDRYQLPRQERQWDERLDERRLQDEMRRDNNRRYGRERGTW
jgi:hypothetical protein